MFISIYDKNPQNKNHLGGKGFGLWQMANMGLPVPKAFVLPTTACMAYRADAKGFMAKVSKTLPSLYAQFPAGTLLSVRSGARVSMPGMMDTILNIGMSGGTLKEWSNILGNECAAACYNRLQSQWESLIEANALPPEDPLKQLYDSIEMVLASWDNPRASEYRKLENIPYEWGTAVIVQQMVFGNRNANSATGVLFTRDPDTGAKQPRCDWLPQAQGEDVVDGSHDCQDWSKVSPKIKPYLSAIAAKLEAFYKDAQDIEWTVDNGKLYILQTRAAKRSSQAAVKIAVDMVGEGLIQPEDAFYRISRKEFFSANLDVVDPSFKGKPIGTGESACSGVATGLVVTSAQAAIDCEVPCILVTEETNPDDIGGMVAAAGVLTMKGGSTSHAAVVARGMNKPCIVGFGGDVSKLEGKTLTLDGATGRVWDKAVPVVAGNNEAVAAFEEMMFKHLNAVPIGDGPGQPVLLDVSEVILINVEAALNTVVDKLASGRAVTLRLTDSSWTTEEKAFHSIFGTLSTNPVPVFLTALYDLLNEEQRSRVWLLDDGSHLFQQAPVVNTLPNLVGASSSGYLDMPVTSSVKKVLDWQKKEGLEFLTIGYVVDGGRAALSREQVVGYMLG